MIRPITLTTFVLFALFIAASGQESAFDIYRFPDPANWKKESASGLVSFTTTSKDNKKYCVITLFPSSAGTGDPGKDFNSEWTRLAVEPFQAIPNPQTETRTMADGWKAIAGAAIGKSGNNELMILLTVFSRPGLKASVMAMLNDGAYATDIDRFLSQLTLDKNATGAGKAVVPPASGKSASTSTTGRFGGIQFKVPAGWTMRPYSGGVDIMPDRIGQGEFLDITFLPSKKWPGSLQEALSNSWEDAARLFKAEKTRTVNNMPYDILTEKKSFHGWNYIRGHGSLRGSSGDFYLHLFIVKLDDRVERVAIVSKENRDNLTNYNTYHNPEFNDAIQEFLFTLQFDDWKEPELQNGELTGNAVCGVWGGMSMMGGKIGNAYAIFFHNGQVYFGSRFPMHGLDGINTWIDSEIVPRYWGSYRIEKGSGIIRMSYGEIPFTLKGSNLILTTNNTDHEFFRLPSVDGARFNGNYALDETYGEIPRIRFTADGRYSDQGALTALEHVTGFPLKSTDRAGNGTYEVRNFTVIFRHADGRRFPVAFTGLGYYKNNPSPPVLTMGWNDDPLKKQ